MGDMKAEVVLWYKKKGEPITIGKGSPQKAILSAMTFLNGIKYPVFVKLKDDIRMIGDAAMKWDGDDATEEV